jgi:hypothetical protein
MFVLASALTACSHRSPATNTSTRPGLSAHASVTLIGFGALRSNWNRTHTEVTAAGCEAGSAYDADPHLDPFPDCPGSKYVAVDGPANRVEAYQVNFPAGTTLAQTLQAETSELPPDALQVSRLTPAGCVITEFRSAALARLDPANLPDGLVSVASETKPTSRRYLDFLPVTPGAAITKC